MNHSVSTFGIIFPLPHIHVAIRIFAKAISIKPPILELPLIANTAIFDEHAQTVMFASRPFTLIVLPLILPNVDAVSIEIVFMKFALKSVSSLFKNEDTKAMHYL